MLIRQMKLYDFMVVQKVVSCCMTKANVIPLPYQGVVVPSPSAMPINPPAKPFILLAIRSVSLPRLTRLLLRPSSLPA